MSIVFKDEIVGLENVPNEEAWLSKVVGTGSDEEDDVEGTEAGSISALRRMNWLWDANIDCMVMMITMMIEVSDRIKWPVKKVKKCTELSLLIELDKLALKSVALQIIHNYDDIMMSTNEMKET